MRLLILYRDKSDHSRDISEFVEMLRRRYPGKSATLEDIDTKEGAADAVLHGVVKYPALIITSYEGRVMQQWEGLPLPTIDEVASLLVVQQGATV